MNDMDCIRIEVLAMAHLIRCAFDDWSLSTLEVRNSLSEIKKGLLEVEE